MTSPRIERGAALLDQHAPGWTTKIDLDALEMEYSDCCILGQLYGDFYEGLNDIEGVSLANAERFGFLRYGSEKYYNLTARWVRYIKERRAS